MSNGYHSRYHNNNINRNLGFDDKFSNMHDQVETDVKKNSNKKKKDIWHVLDTFASYTSLQGVPYIQRSNRWWSTIFWVLTFVAGIGALLVHGWYLIKNYILLEYSTVLTLGYAHLPFPTVTICNLNPILASQINNTSPEMADFLRGLEPPKELDSKHRQMDPNQAPPPEGPPDDGGLRGPGNLRGVIRNGRVSSQQQQQQQQQQQPPGNEEEAESRPPPRHRPTKDGESYTFSEVKSDDEENREKFLELYGKLPMKTRKDVGHQAALLIQDCVFNGYKCSNRDFSHQFSPIYGNCWSFNSAEHENHTQPVTSFVSGKDYGLNLRLFLETNEYINGVSSEVGAVVSVHTFDQLTFPEQSGIPIAPGLSTQIGLKLINITRLGEPYEACQMPDGTEFESLYGSGYTREACMAMCPYKQILDLCGCYVTPYENYFPRNVITTSRQCTTERDHHCIENITTDVANGVRSCDCPSACFEKNYDSLISSSSWPHDSFYYKIVNSACDLDDGACKHLLDDPQTSVPQNFANLKIYYRDLNYENIVEQPAYDFVQFVSDIGGVLGLWIGVSILTVIELLQLAVELISHCCKRGCRTS